MLKLAEKVQSLISATRHRPTGGSGQV